MHMFWAQIYTQFHIILRSLECEEEEEEEALLVLWQVIPEHNESVFPPAKKPLKAPGFQNVC